MNKHLTEGDVRQAFLNCHLEEVYAFLAEDLEKLADAFVAAAEPRIIKAERERNIEFVRSLNTEVAHAMSQYADNV